jgi:hypothetical protein
MTAYRVIHRVAPYPHEDVTGYLMRVAARNRAAGPGELLSLLVGSPTGAVRTDDLARLAHYCRARIPEAAGLSGVVRRGGGQSPAWQIAGVWVTKAAFVAPHRSRVCPACLREAPYLRGIWSLTLYGACSTHGCRLVTHCPGCRRVLKWNRRYATRCGCGYDLTGGPTIPGDDRLLQLAALIDACGGDGMQTAPNTLPRAVGERLGVLSLDGLLKVVWFLGRCIGDAANCRTSHGHAHPDIDSARRIAARAFALLEEWPHRLVEEIEQLAQRTPADTSAALLDRLFGPAQYYAREELVTDELAPWRHAYEQIVVAIWRRAGHRCRSLPGSRQWALPFD